MRISDWSSDVCSSDLGISMAAAGLVFATRSVWMAARQVEMTVLQDFRIAGRPEQREDRGVGGERDKPSRETHLSGPSEDRKSVVQGQSGSGRVDRGGRRTIKKKKKKDKRDGQTQ